MQRTTLLAAEGMDCGACGDHVQLALERHEGVRSVTVRLAAHEVEVVHDTFAAEADELARFLTLCGYPARVAA